MSGDASGPFRLFRNGLPPNGFGLYDMVGNVWEWVEDCHGGSYETAETDSAALSDPQTWDCRAHTARGGSWTDRPSRIRSAARNVYPASIRFANLGFRVARTLSAGAGAIAPGER